MSAFEKIVHWCYGNDPGQKTRCGRYTCRGLRDAKVTHRIAYVTCSFCNRIIHAPTREREPG